MSNEDKMNIDERGKYLRRMKKRYVQAGRKEQGHLLDEMEAVTELHRKSLIRLMNGSLERKPRQRQRGRTLRQAQGKLYGLEVEYALVPIRKPALRPVPGPILAPGDGCESSFRIGS